MKALEFVAEKAEGRMGQTITEGYRIGFAIDDRKSVAPRGIALVAMGVTVSVARPGYPANGLPCQL